MYGMQDNLLSTMYLVIFSLHSSYIVDGHHPASREVTTTASCCWSFANNDDTAPLLHPQQSEKAHTNPESVWYHSNDPSSTRSYHPLEMLDCKTDIVWSCVLPVDITNLFVPACVWYLSPNEMLLSKTLILIPKQLLSWTEICNVVYHIYNKRTKQNVQPWHTFLVK